MDDWQRAATTVSAAKARLRQGSPRDHRVGRRAAPPKHATPMDRARDIISAHPALAVIGIAAAGLVVTRVPGVRTFAVDAARIAVRVGVTRFLTKRLSD